MSKQRRQKILNLITENAIETQEELQYLLKQNGFDVTQSTISRDIKQMHIIKASDGKGHYCYTSAFNSRVLSDENKSRYRDVFSKSVINIQYAMNDVVVKCYTGMAQGACVAIDAMFSDILVGTLAGDDTVLAITKDEKNAAELVDKLKNLL